MPRPVFGPCVQRFGARGTPVRPSFYAWSLWRFSMPFDPDAAAAPGTGVFGLPFTEAESQVVLLPVPFDATTSYRRGTANGPEAIRAASMQVDLYDRRFGRVYERGIFMQPEPAAIRRLSDRAGELAAPLIAGGGTTGD